MSRLVGLGADSAWTAVVRRVSADALLRHVHAQWMAYAAACTAQGISLQKRSEPELTKALQAQLARSALVGKQPFDGDFVAELQRFDLDPTTMRATCQARTDIEWLLSGFPRFTIEFKLLDGGPRLRTAYWRQGLAKFAAGTYAPHALEGAMWAFLRIGGTRDSANVRMLLDKRGANLGAANPMKPTDAPSGLCALAAFDTAHNRRDTPSPITVAHVFVALP